MSIQCSPRTSKRRLESEELGDNADCMLLSLLVFFAFILSFLSMYGLPIATLSFREVEGQMGMRLCSFTKATESVGQPTICIAANPFTDPMHVSTGLKDGRTVN